MTPPAPMFWRIQSLTWAQKTTKWYVVDLEMTPLGPAPSCAGSVVDPFQAYADLSPYDAAGLDYTIPAPSVAPSIMFAAAMAAEHGTSIYNTIEMAAPWTLLDSWFVTCDPCHDLSGVGYLVSNGSSRTLNINYQRPIDASTCVLACTIVTNETGPVSGQHAMDQDGGGTPVSLTVPNPIAAGNLLLLVIMTAGPTTGVPSGWTEVVYKDDIFSAGGPSPDSMGIWMKCADGSEGDTILVPANDGQGRQVYLSEWAIS